MEILLSVIATILTGIASYIGILIKDYFDNIIKKQVVESSVKYVEQVYKDIHGEEKFNKAVEIIMELLEEKGLKISEIEVKMLIEATCCEFCKSGGKDGV